MPNTIFFTKFYSVRKKGKFYIVNIQDLKTQRKFDEAVKLTINVL